MNPSVSSIFSELNNLAVPSRNSHELTLSATLHRKKIRRQHVEVKAKEPKAHIQEPGSNNGTTEIDLLELLMVFRRHLLLIIACFAVGLAAAPVS
jgi:hypothetical protein